MSNPSLNPDLKDTDDDHCSRSQWLLWAAAAVLVSAVWTWFHLDRGWFPHDEGQLGQAAERVLVGQIPHRDFDDMYTGGLSYLNGLSFRLFGVNSMSMRWMLFMWQIVFLFVVYILGTNFLRPKAAALVTILANVWSIPLYSAAMPSWYNLYLAAGVAALMFLFIRQNSRKYLLLAGLGIGASIAIKSSGLFLLAATLMALLYRNQIQFAGRTNGGQWLSILISIALIGVSFLSLVFVTRLDPYMQVIHFVIPFVGVTMFVLFHEWSSLAKKFTGNGGIISESKRLNSLLQDGAVLTCGVALPLLALVQVFWRADALDDLYRGVFVYPKLRMEHAAASFASWQSMLFCFPLMLVIYSGMLPKTDTALNSKATDNRSQLWVIGVSVIAFGAVLISNWTKLGFAICFFSFRNAIPLIVISNLAILYLKRGELSPISKQKLFTLTAICFFVSLIQFPFAVALYFFYAAPMALLTAVAGARACGTPTGWPQAAVLMFFIAMAIFRFDGTWPDESFQEGFQKRTAAKLETERSQLVVDNGDAKIYGQLQAMIDRYSSPGDTVFAMPDSPEVCYLTNREPFNGVMYEFFRADLYADEDNLMREIIDADVKLIVINESPPFSTPVSKKLLDRLRKEFDLTETISANSGAGKEAKTKFSIYRKTRTDSARSE
jgi:hypothetical protein